MKALLVLLSIAALVSAQYLTNPLPSYPAGGQQLVARQNNGPCGFPLNGSIVWNTPMSYEAGRWMTGLQANTQTVTIQDNEVIMFSLYSYPPDNGTVTFLQNVGNLTWGVLKTGASNTPQAGASVNTLSRLRLGDDVLAGQYLFQMRYANFYSCSLIEVNATSGQFRISSAGAVEQIDATLPGQWRHFDVMFPAGANLVMRLTGQPTPYTMAVAGANIVDNQLPTDSNGLALETPLNTANVAAGEAVIGGICAPNFATQPVVYTVGVYTDPQAQPTDPAASIEFQVFNSRLNRTIDVPAHSAGKMYFWTTARSSETDGTIRIVLKSTSGNAPTVNGATNCGFNTGLFSASTVDSSLGGEYNCIEAPQAAGTKYLRVDETASSYQIYAEKGKCAELGSASLMSISLALILAALFLTL